MSTSHHELKLYFDQNADSHYTEADPHNFCIFWLKVTKSGKTFKHQVNPFNTRHCEFKAEVIAAYEAWRTQEGV